MLSCFFLTKALFSAQSPYHHRKNNTDTFIAGNYGDYRDFFINPHGLKYLSIAVHHRLPSNIRLRPKSQSPEDDPLLNSFLDDPIK